MNIGLDFGLHSIRVGVFVDGEVSIVQFDGGKRALLADVQYEKWDDFSFTVGNEAHEASLCDQGGLATHLKELLGSDAAGFCCTVQQHRLPINADMAPKFHLHASGAMTQLTVADALSWLLKKVASVVENQYGQEINHCVISMPVNWSEAKREQVTKAWSLAERPNVRVECILDSTAAALGYFYRSSVAAAVAATLIFVDVGALRCQVSAGVLHAAGTLQFCCPTRFVETGGNRIRDLLVGYCIDEFAKTTTAPDAAERIRNDNFALYRLRDACEQAVEQLTTAKATTVRVSHIAPNSNLQVIVSVAQFRRLMESQTLRIVLAIESVVSTMFSNQTSESADFRLVLSGAASRSVRELLANLYPNKVAENVFSHADNMIVTGLALAAALNVSGAELSSLLCHVIPEIANGFKRHETVDNVLMRSQELLLTAAEQQAVTVNRSIDGPLEGTSGNPRSTYDVTNNSNHVDSSESTELLLSIPTAPKPEIYRKLYLVRMLSASDYKLKTISKDVSPQHHFTCCVKRQNENSSTWNELVAGTTVGQIWMDFRGAVPDAEDQHFWIDDFNGYTMFFMTCISRGSRSPLAIVLKSADDSQHFRELLRSADDKYRLDCPAVSCTLRQS